LPWLNIGRKSQLRGEEVVQSEINPKRARGTTARSVKKRWSRHVTKTSDASDLRQGVFKLTDPTKIASLKRSAGHGSCRKANPHRSALSTLTFHINRAGKTTHLSRLEEAKAELKKEFGHA
jgi:hypothetical protein